MSKFDNKDLFGSGKHRIAWDRVESDGHSFGFEGVNGSFEVGYGFRRRTGKIKGTLRATTLANLRTLESEIIAYTITKTSGKLVDGLDEEWTDVVLMAYTPIGGPIKSQNAGDWMLDYEVTIRKLTL